MKNKELIKKHSLKKIKILRNGPLNNLTNMPNKILPGLQKCSKIGFTYPQRSAPVGITKGPPVRLNTMLWMFQLSHITELWMNNGHIAILLIINTNTVHGNNI